MVALAALIGLLSLFSQVASAQQDAQQDVVEIGSGTLSSDRVENPRWVRVNFEPLVTGLHTIRVVWDGAESDLHFNVRPVGGRKLGATVKGSNPGVWTGELDVNQEYFLGIWAVAGAPTFTASIEANPTDPAPVDPEPVDPEPSLVITAQPINLSAVEGETAVFSVSATGNGALGYQWFATASTEPLDDDNAVLVNPVVAIPDATGAEWVLTAVSPADAQSTYFVEVNDQTGATVVSDSVSLTVEPVPAVQPVPLVIAVQPADSSVEEGDAAEFSIEASGSGVLSYQWFVNDTVIADAVADTLVIADASVVDDGAVYRVEVTDDNVTVSSDEATLIVTAAPAPVTILSIGQGTLDSERIAAQRFVRLTFDALATAIHTITVAWDSDADVKFNVLSSNGTRLNSAVISDSNPGVWTGMLESGEQYSLGVWSTKGVANYTATIEASVSLAIDVQPVDASVTAGSDATFTVGASSSGNLGYQWFKDDVLMAGETSSTLTVFATLPEEDGSTYSVDVSDGTETIRSGVATLTVRELADIGPFSLAADTSTWMLDGPAPVLDFTQRRVNDGWGRVLLRIDDLLLVGGDFTGIKAGRNSPVTDRPWLAAFDAVSGQPVSTFAVPSQVSSVVRALALSDDGQQIFVGGDFGLLALNAGTWAVEFALEVGLGNEMGRVFDIAVTPTQVYIGGDFNQIDGTSRENIARLSLDGQLDDSWAPNVRGGTRTGRQAPVQAIAVSASGAAVYVGGTFNSINDIAVPISNVDLNNPLSMLVVDAGDGAAVLPERFRPIDDGSEDKNVRVLDFAVTDEYVIIAWGGPNFLSFHSPDGTLLRQYVGVGDLQALQVVGNRVFVGHHGEFLGTLEEPIPQEAVTSIDPKVFVPYKLKSFRLDQADFPLDQAWQIRGIFGIWGIAATEDSIWVTGQIHRAGSNNQRAAGLVKFPALD
jgi:hypothetical protein